MSQNLVAESHYFRDGASPETQSATQAFGPVSGSEESQYRITSKFTSGSKTKAYAVCTGQVLLVPQTDSTKVNLILRPFIQPIKELKVKYFIYRGLDKKDFIPSGNENLVAFENKDTASELIQVLWTQLVKFDSDAQSAPFQAGWIGYDPSRPDSVQIDDLFFLADAFNDGDNESLKPFELPIIAKGTELGNFIGEYGFEVVLSDGDYKAGNSSTGFQFDMNYAKAGEVIIDVSQLPTGYSETEYRESISHFMDPAAYYGLHVSEVGKVWVRQAANATKKEGAQIYSDVIDKFFTKNRVYLHIQGHLGRSYNYFKTYSALVSNENVIQFGMSEDTLVATTFPVNKWPVLIDESTGAGGDDQRAIIVKLVHDFTTGPVLHASIGNLGEEANNGFLLTEQLVPAITESPEDDEAVFTAPVKVWVPATGSAGAKKHVASFVKLLYKGTQPGIVSELENTAIKTIDTLFSPVDAQPRFVNSAEEKIEWSSRDGNELVQTKSIDTNSPDGQLVLQLKIVNNKIARTEGEDTLVASSVIFETLLDAVASKGTYQDNYPQNEQSSAGSRAFNKADNNTYRLQSPNYLNIQFFMDEYQLIKGVRIANAAQQYTNKYMVGISQDQHDTLSAMVSTNNLRNTFLFFSLLIANASTYISTDNVLYDKYRLGVMHETSSKMQVMFPEEEIFIYSLDRNSYFSAEYSQYVQDDSPLTFDLTIEKTL